jgi:hypothetical protein
MTTRLSIALLLAALTAGLVPAFADAATYYIDRDPPCSDSNRGTRPSAPWCSLAKANSAPAGSTVVVRDASSSYGDLSATVPNLSLEGENGPIVGEVNARANGQTFRGLVFRADTPHVAGSDARQVSRISYLDNEFDRAVLRLRGASNVLIAGNHFHDGPTKEEVDATGAWFCPCAIDLHPYDSTRTTDVTIRDNLIENWTGDGVHVNTATGITIDGNVLRNGSATGGDHVDVFQLLGVEDYSIRNNRAYEWQHGVLTTDKVPVDGPDADNRAGVFENNLIETRVGYAFNGGPGPNALVVNNTFSATSENVELRGVTVPSSVGDDPQGSEGAVFANNAVQGEIGVSSSITAHHNLALDPFGFASGYEPPAGHAAVDAADPRLAPTLDLKGRSRVGPPDIGAFERQGDEQVVDLEAQKAELLNQLADRDQAARAGSGRANAHVCRLTDTVRPH